MKRMMMMLVPAAMLLGACDDQTNPPDEERGLLSDESADDVDDVDGDAPAKFRRRGKHRRGAMIERMCDHIDCTDEQQDKIEALAENFPRPDRSDRKARKDANSALAAAFRSESFDGSALAAYHQAMTAKAATRDGAIAQVVVDLHQIVTPEQRDDLAEVIEQRGLPFGHRGGRHGGKGKGQRKGKGGDGKFAGKGGKHRAEKKVQKLCAAIECTDAQRAEILTTFEAVAPPDRSAHESANRSLAEAFRGATLDAATVSKHVASVRATKDAHRSKMDGALVTLHGILDAKQRDLMAQRIEERGLKGLQGRGHGRGGRGKGRRRGGE